MNTELPIIGSPSRSQTACNCHRKHSISDIICQHPKDRQEAALEFGTVLHFGAAEWWTVGSEEAAVTCMHEAYEERERWFYGDDKHSLELADVMLRYYTANAKLAGGHWFADEGEWEVVMVEERVIVELDPRARLSYQVDRLVREVNHDLYVLVDLKTASRITDYWSRGFPRSLQQQLYAYGVRGQGYELADHFIEGLLKKADCDIRYVDLPAWSESQLEEAKELFVKICQTDAELVARSMQPDGTVDVDELTRLILTETEYNGDHCFAYGKPCPYLDLCNSPPDERFDLLRADYEWVEPEYLA